MIWTDPVKADLRSIHDFIAPDSRHYARKVVQDIVDKTDVLHRLPRIGRKEDRELLRQSQKVERLPDEDEIVIETLLDAFLTNQRLQSLTR